MIKLKCILGPTKNKNIRVHEIGHIWTGHALKLLQKGLKYGLVAPMTEYIKCTCTKKLKRKSTAM